MGELAVQRQCGNVVIATLERRTSVVWAKNDCLWSVCNRPDTFLNDMAILTVCKEDGYMFMFNSI